MATETPYKKGYEAATRKVAYNPYIEGTNEYEKWEKGYEDGMKDQKSSNEELTG